MVDICTITIKLLKYGFFVDDDEVLVFFLFYHVWVVLFSSGRSLCSKCVRDELVDAGRPVHRSEEERLQHAAVDAEQRVEGEQERRVAQFLRGVRPLDELLESLTGLGVDCVSHVASFQRRRACHHITIPNNDV